MDKNQPKKVIQQKTPSSVGQNQNHIDYLLLYEAFSTQFQLLFKIVDINKLSIQKTTRIHAGPSFALKSQQQPNLNNPFLFYSAFLRDRLYQFIPSSNIQMNSDLTTLIEDSFALNSCDFSLECLRITSVSKKKNYSGLQDDSRKKSKKKHWKPQENNKYVQFLRENMSLFEKNREDKRLMKINILMSNYVKSKNSTQCRSHHQKMLAHYKTIENIIVCLTTQAEAEKVTVKEVEVVPVEAQEEFQEENYEEFEEVYEEKPMFEKDVFEVLDNNCWGYMDLANIEKM